MKRLLVGGAVLAVGIAGTGLASAQAPSGFKVTGGGQIIENPQGGGPGDTVGFNARRTSENGPEAKGQFQYIDRDQSTNASAPEESFHGVVTCLISGGEAIANEMDEMDMTGDNEALREGEARFGGFLRDDPKKFFTVDVSDNGQGGDAEDDMILVRITQEPCADNPEDESNSAEELARLGRGNVKIHNNPDDAAMASTVARLAS